MEPTETGWSLFSEKELETMMWSFLLNRKDWDEANVCLREGDYEAAEKKAKEWLERNSYDIMPYLILLEAQHRKGDFMACSKTYRESRDKTVFFDEIQKSPLVLEYCEAMRDLQSNYPAMIQTAWMGAHDCLNKIMRSRPPERAYVICIRAFEAALASGKPLFGGNEDALIKDYIKSGLSWYPESKTLLAMQAAANKE